MVAAFSPPTAPAIPRYVQAKVAVALQDTRVVLVVGPRQAGKTTLARQYAGPERPYITLDDPTTLCVVSRTP